MTFEDFKKLEEQKRKALENKECIKCKYWEPYKCYNEKSEKYITKYEDEVLATDYCFHFRLDLS